MARGSPTSPEVKRKIIADIKNGWAMTEIAKRHNVAYSVVKKINAGGKEVDGKSLRQAANDADLPSVKPLDSLTGPAARALTDFGYFRERYLGRRSSPWQEQAAYRIVDLLESPRKEYAVINCPPGVGKPVAEDALVTMGDGSLKPLRDICVGDWVISHQGRPCRVQAVHEQGHLPVARVTDDRGREVYAALDHPFLTFEDGWVEVKNLTAHRLVTLADIDPHPVVGSYRPRHEYRMAGYFVGDGSCSAGNAAITNADPAILDDIDWISGEMGWSASAAPRNGCAAVTKFGGGARDWLKEAKLYGCTSHTKLVPDWVFQGPADHIASFIGAYFACDGTVGADTGPPEFYSVNEPLLRQVQHLLGRLGIQSRLTSKLGSYKGKPHHSFRLIVIDAGLFAERVPVVGDKSYRLQRLVGKERSTRARQGWVTTELQTDTRACRCLTVEEDQSFIVNDFVVHNSTTFTHDIPAWLTVRNRAIRGLMGHRAEREARKYTGRLRRTLERRIPVKADIDLVDRGLAVDAQATLIEDFGRFKPLVGDVWRVEEFVVAQHGDVAIEDKEMTWTAYGMDSAQIGNRFNFVIWDDLVDKSVLRTYEMIDKQREWFDDEAETRLEPAGLFVLQGQRLGANDLYRYALDKLGYTLDEIEEIEIKPEDSPKKYHHIVYRAHDDTKCTGEHKGLAPWPDSCLLDPIRLPWRELQVQQRNNPDKYAVLYQQEDTDPAGVLVNKIWVSGGKDETGVDHPGCWDTHRGVAELPRDVFGNIALTGDLLSVATADPSPTKFWSIQWWIYHPDTEQRFLMDLVRQGMEAPDFLDYSITEQKYTGLMDEWQSRSEDLGIKITHWIVEANAAQRFMLQYNHVKMWMAKRSVEVIPHQTAKNKTDPERGVWSLAPHYRFGRVRLPGKQDGSRLASMKLVDEATRYPHSLTDDCVMAQWFFEWNLPNIYIPRGQVKKLWRPSWLR